MDFNDFNNDPELSGGYTALRSKIFVCRAVACGLSLISLSVMGACPFINYALVTPTEIFTENCPDHNYLSGHFNFRAYEAVLAIVILVFIYSLVFSIYFLLPVDENNQKYVPGESPPH